MVAKRGFASTLIRANLPPSLAGATEEDKRFEDQTVLVDEQSIAPPGN